MTKEQIRKGFFLFAAFIKSMLFAFTGGMTAVPILENEIVKKRGWMTEEEFWQIPPLSQSLPGVISIHNAIQIGYALAGAFGAFMASLGTVVVAFTSMILIAILFRGLLGNPHVTGFIQGIRAVSIAVLLNGVRSLWKNCEKDFFSICIALLALVLPLFFGFPTFYTILLCGGLGIIWVLTHPEKEDEPK